MIAGPILAASTAAFYAGFSVFIVLLAILTGFVISFVRSLNRKGRGQNH